MKLFFSVFLWVLGSSLAFGQNAKPYQIYNQRGKRVTFKKMVKKLAKNDVVLFGENHDNSIVHWLELQTLKALYADKGEALVAGAEMFERDIQEMLDAYLEDSLSLDDFKSQSRPWPNFKTDYLPLLTFAKENDLRFIATNVPRSYAAIVAREEKGLDSLERLEPAERKRMAQLPIDFSMETPGYQEMEEMMKDHAGPNAQNYVKAQALKDATMAESIFENRHDKDLFLHFNGDFHSKEHGGIYWYLKNRSNDLRVAVISIVETEDESLSLDSEKPLTEFVIVIPSDMTKTY